MLRRLFTFISLFVVVFLVAGCGWDTTGLNYNPACCEEPTPPCTITCPALDPVTDQRILVGDTIEIFFNGNTTAATWKYDSTVFAPTRPADFVQHRASTVSHIALRALATEVSSITASAGASEGRVTVAMILPSEIRGLDVRTRPCRYSVTDPWCDTMYAWDTASFKTGDTLRVVSSTWTKEGGLVTANARWSSNNQNVATVGRVFSNYYTAWLPVVIAKGPGVATISATVAGYSGSMDVTVVR